MTRAWLAPLCALLAVALTAPVRAPAALPVTAYAGQGGVTVAWRPPAGQQLACAFRAAPAPVEPLGCVRGAGNSLTLPRGGDVNLRVTLGDTVEVKSYGAKGDELARGRARVGWRVWLPRVGR